MAKNSVISLARDLARIGSSMALIAVNLVALVFCSVNIPIIVTSNLRRNYDKDVREQDPKYVFFIPGVNKTLVFHKHDFAKAIYPNVSNLNSFKVAKKNKNSYTKDLQLSDSVINESFQSYYKNVNSDFDNIVEENESTEKNFVDFVDIMNQDLISRKEKPVSGNEPNWDDFDLGGWTGSLVKIKPSAKNKATKRPDFHEIEIQEEEKVKSSLYDKFISNMIKLKDLWPASKIPDMSVERPQTETSIQWPLTNPRRDHKDNDIFIGRANNPFGHSTKWSYKNGTDDNSGRSKRGAVHLYSMIKCSTGCDPLVYKGYGCYCGFLGSGFATDGIDKCCKMHDYCYSHSDCPSYLEYFIPYLWKCYRGKPLCAVDHGEFGGPSSCAARLCECDLLLAKCLRRYFCPQRRNVCTSNPLRLIQNLAMVF